MAGEAEGTGEGAKPETGAPAKTETTKTDPPAGTKPETDPLEAELGPAGMKALRAERAAREAAERDRDKLTTERDELKAKTQSEAEKAIEAAKKEGREEATLEANRRIAKSEVRAAAGGKVADVDDAVTLLGDLDRFIVKGEVDSKAIATAIETLVKDKPYLAPVGKARPLPGGGATQTSGSTFNDAIRSKIRRNG